MIDVAEIKRQVTPVEAIERYTNTRRYQNKYPCPFHADKNPSLSVKADIWNCWACGEHGDVIDFVKKYFDLSFKEAALKLAKDFNIDIETPDSVNSDPWNMILAEIKRDRTQELQQIRDDLDKEIALLTTTHRLLFRLGYSQKVCNRYIQDIDQLEAYKQIWR